jgi:hypothetical protein
VERRASGAGCRHAKQEEEHARTSQEFGQKLSDKEVGANDKKEGAAAIGRKEESRSEVETRKKKGRRSKEETKEAKEAKAKPRK